MSKRTVPKAGYAGDGAAAAAEAPSEPASKAAKVAAGAPRAVAYRGDICLISEGGEDNNSITTGPMFDTYRGACIATVAAEVGSNVAVCDSRKGSKYKAYIATARRALTIDWNDESKASKYDRELERAREAYTGQYGYLFDGVEKVELRARSEASAERMLHRVLDGSDGEDEEDEVEDEDEEDEDEDDE